MMCPDSSFDELLKVVIMNDQLPCDQDVDGCGKPNHIHHILSTFPHVFTVGKLFFGSWMFQAAIILHCRVSCPV